MHTGDDHTLQDLVVGLEHNLHFRSDRHPFVLASDEGDDDEFGIRRHVVKAEVTV